MKWKGNGRNTRKKKPSKHNSHTFEWAQLAKSHKHTKTHKHTYEQNQMPNIFRLYRSIENLLPRNTKTKQKSNACTHLIHSAYLCAKCKVLFDTITIYDEHLENCKNSPENYNLDEVLDKIR